jgi:GDP-L-fucose synthase
MIGKDLDKRPVEGISGRNTESEINAILSKYGIIISSKGVEVILWGTGKPRREFLYSDELADACVFVMQNADFKDLQKLSKRDERVINTHINIGTGIDQTISELAQLIKNIYGFRGQINWNPSKPDGTFQKLMEVSKLALLGWKARIDLQAGIEMVINQYARMV